MNYYRRFVGDYLRDTSRLSMLEHGAYNLLLDYYYAEEKPIALDLDEVCRMVRAIRPEERKAVSKVLGSFFRKATDGYHHKRVDKEISVARSAIEKQRLAGIESAARRWSTHESTHESTDRSSGSLAIQPPTTNLQPPTSNLQPPVTNHQPKAKPNGDGRALALPEWLPQDAWQAWLKGRKARSNTPEALLLAIKRLEKWRAGGMDPRAVLEQSVVNGWQGLFELRAERGAVVGKQASLEARNRAASEEWLKRKSAEEKIIDSE